MSTSFESSMPTTPSSMPSMTPSYMPQEDCTQQAMQLVSSAMRHLDGQISEEVWEDIMEECMKVVHPTASYGMVSTHIMKCCKRKIPTRLQMSLMEFIASQKAFTGGGQTSGHASAQCADDAVGSTTRRSRTIGENEDEETNEEEDRN